MQLTLTNNTPYAVPLVSANEGGWAELLEPNTPTVLTHTNSEHVIVGNEPSVAEEILNGDAALAETFVTNLMTWQNLNGQLSADTVPVNVIIQNNGENPVRATSGYGYGVPVHNVQPGEIYNAFALGYVELQEIGQGENAEPESAAAEHANVPEQAA
jgi:hypothetical protein